MLESVRDLVKSVVYTWEKRLDRRLLLVAQSGSLKALLRPSIFQVIALLLTILVYSVVAYLSLFAFDNLVSASTFWLQFLAGLLLAFLFWSTWPRFMHFPPPEVVADPVEFPELNRLISEIADRLSVATPVLVLTEQFDAAFGRIGARRRPVLILGNPLIATLSENELIAVIAHEIGHARDGAITRTLFVRMAHGVIKRWKKIYQSATTFELSVLTVIAKTLTLPLYLALVSTDWLFEFCAARDAKRAEYVADTHSIRLAGSFNSHQLSTRFLYGSLPEVRAAYTEAIPERRFRALHEAVSTLTEGEQAWLNEAAQNINRDRKSLHPPLHDRQAFADSIVSPNTQVSLKKEQFALIQNEIARWPIVIYKRELELRNSTLQKEQNQQSAAHTKVSRKEAGLVR